MQQDIDGAHSALMASQERASSAKSALDAWRSATTQTTTNSNARNRRSNQRPDYATLAGRSAAAIPSNQKLIDVYEEAHQDLIKSVKDHEDAVKKIDDFEKDHSTTFEDFMDLGMEAARPMIDEYKRLFISPKGDY